MSAEVLRRAAVLMRERADVAFDANWRLDPDDPQRWLAGNLYIGESFEEDIATHCASWHPAVALAVADQLAAAADGWVADPGCDLGGGFDFSPACDSCFRCHAWESQMCALVVARAYLGSNQ